MHCVNQNSYLQLACTINPRIINRTVNRALQRKIHLDFHDGLPPIDCLESKQPSLYAPTVDLTRAKMGYGRNGLRNLIMQLHSKDITIQKQAIYTILDRLQISEDAYYLIRKNLVYRLVDLMMDGDTEIRETICRCITEIAKYPQGRAHMKHDQCDLMKHLMYIALNDYKEIRYQAALAFETIARYTVKIDSITKRPEIIECLLKAIEEEHSGIILLHLKTLTKLFEFDPVTALRANAFRKMLCLFKSKDYRIGSQAMENMAQLCKHEIGQRLADENDINRMLIFYLKSSKLEVAISAAGVMCFTTLTTRSKWRIKEHCRILIKILLRLTKMFNKPMMQLRCLQILINICDCPDIRSRAKMFLDQIENIDIRTHEEWDGSTKTSTFSREHGHYYRTMCIEGIETVKNIKGDTEDAVEVHSYVKTIRDKKQQLIDCLKFKPWHTQNILHSRC